MDAIVGSSNTTLLNHHACRMLALAALLVISGCQGKSLVDENPVFAQAPPRGALMNRSTADVEPEKTSEIRPISGSTELLGGNSVVAEVNGAPIFVDDLIGSVRLAVEAEPTLTDEQRQAIMYKQIRDRLDSYVEQEIVLQALNKAVPADRQELINESLEEPFQDVIADIKKKNNVTTDGELNEILAEEGVSIDLLRESFVRIQKVQGYLSTLAAAPKNIDRPEIVEYYRSHQADFTSEERVRWQEIVLFFDNPEQKAAAEQKMTSILQQLQSGADFGDLAADHSDTLSAEKRGDMGWLTPGALADKQLDAVLMSLKTGQMTDVIVKDNRLELYRVAEHQYAETSPLQEVQQQIEQQLKSSMQAQSRKDVLDKLRGQATVVTMFDDKKSDNAAGDTLPRF